MYHIRRTITATADKFVLVIMSSNRRLFISLLFTCGTVARQLHQSVEHGCLGGAVPCELGALGTSREPAFGIRQRSQPAVAVPFCADSLYAAVTVSAAAATGANPHTGRPGPRWMEGREQNDRDGQRRPGLESGARRGTG